jgi:hypothetical protein
LASEDAKRLDKIRSLFPSAGTHGGNKKTMNWMYEELFEIARNSAPKLNYAKFYNALFYIQEEY